MILEGKTVLVAGVGTGLGREVADAAIFFASNLARAITGQHLLVNSGELMR